LDERLQKVLARAGIASRRKAEEMIAEGRVEVNNQKVTQLGTKVDAKKDLIRVDGKALVEAEDERVYLVLYKPAGVVTTLSDPEGRPSVGGLIKGITERVFPVGRLDYDAEGALILTNDGELAHKLTHPSFGVRRTYLAKVRGKPEDKLLQKLRAGIKLEDGIAKPLEVKIHSHAEKNTWIRIVVSEGRPHLIKRLFLAIDHPVQRLYRPDYAGISVEGMEPGTYRTLGKNETLLLAGGGDPDGGRNASLPARRHGRGPGGSSASLGIVKKTPSARGRQRRRS
jgi:23S rRNA pseudouridine2605 synthase